jgi:hypothetical protein
MQAPSRASAAVGHVAGVTAQAFLIGAILAVVALALSAALRPAGSFGGVPTTYAATGGSSVWIESTSGARLTSGGVHFGDPFGVGYSTKERKPWAHAICFANDSTVFAEANPDGSIWGMYFSVYSGGPQAQHFVAGESVDGNWASGGADCRVDLVRFSSDYARETVLASTRFSVAP